MIKTVQDPSALATELSPNHLVFVQDVKKKVDSILASPTFGTGAPVNPGNEQDMYFDTTPSPYHGYVFHLNAWHRFS